MDKIKKAFGRVQYNSPVILSYAILSFLVLVLQVLTKKWTTIHMFSVYQSSPLDPLFYIRLFGHALGHANFEHYFNNFLLILLVGPMLEEKYGSKNTLFMILITTLVTGVFHVIFSNTALLGASGVVFMMILLSSFTNFQKGRIPMTLLLCIAIYIGQEVINVVTVVDNVSQVSHILGGICGAIFGFFMNTAKHKTVEEIK